MKCRHENCSLNSHCSAASLVLTVQARMQAVRKPQQHEVEALESRFPSLAPTALQLLKVRLHPACSARSSVRLAEPEMQKLGLGPQAAQLLQSSSQLPLCRSCAA